MDRQVLTDPEAFKRCLGGHVSDVRHAAMSETRRQNQYLADVTREMKKVEEEMRKFGIRTHRKPETGGMPRR